MTGGQPLPAYARLVAGGLELRLKVVPGASRSRVVGLLADQLKVQVATPPEDGKANAAVLTLLAAWLGCSPRDLELTAGHSQPRKTVLVRAPVALPASRGWAGGREF